MVRAPWGYGLQQRIPEASGMVLGKPAGEGESPVGARETLWEGAETTP